jgi:aminocarboxymuconate-semialdehyde decarboxylase
MTGPTRSDRLDAPTLDMHTHFFPDGLNDFAASTGDPRWPSLSVNPDGSARIMRGSEVFRPVAAATWNLERRAEAMDAQGVDHHVLSPVPIMLTTWADPALAARYSRVHNEAFAMAVAAGPAGRFSWIGSVPLQDGDLAAAELEYCVQNFGMTGVEIGSEVTGRELDHPSLTPFFAAAEALDVAVFIHPTDGAGAIRRGGVPYEFAIGMLTDTAMAVTSLVFGGVLDAHPKLRIGLAHGCGTFPWAYPRIARGATLGPGAKSPDDLLAHTGELLRRLWVDTLVFDPSHVPLLIERFGVDHLMLGSDFPFYPPSFGHALDVVDASVRCGHCSVDEGAAMYGANAEVFLRMPGRGAAARSAARQGTVR